MQALSSSAYGFTSSKATPRQLPVGPFTELKARIEYVFVIVVVTLSTGAFVDLWLTPDGHATQESIGDARLQAVWFVLYLVMFCFAVFRVRRILRTVLQAKWVWVLVLLAVFSTFWSLDPSLTLRRSAALILTTLFGVYLSARYTLTEQLQILGLSLALITVASGFAAIFIPSHSFAFAAGSGSATSLRGIFGHKNGLARVMVFAMLVFAILARRHIRKWYWVGLSGASALLLYLSHSATGIVVLIGLGLSWLALSSTRSKTAKSAACAMLLALAAILSGLWVGQNIDQVLSLLGRDSTLTGRRLLWLVSFTQVRHRPWLGAGYDAFWSSFGGDLESSIGWAAPHGHNGFLDLTLTLGLVGTGIFCALFVYYFGKAIALSTRRSTSVEMFPCLYFAFYFLYNLTEDTILSRNNLFWVLFVSMVCTVRRAAPVPSHSPRCRGAEAFQEMGRDARS